MIEHGLPTLNPNRVISKEPNKLLRRITDSHPGFFSEQNAGLCNKTPLNMIAVLLLRSLEKEILEIFQDYEIEISINHYPNLHRCVSLFSDIPIRINTNSRSDQSPLIRVPFVLHKQYCGYESAVVLTGDLAGLIVNPFPLEKTQYCGMVPNRLWNDYQATEILLADEPQFFGNLKCRLNNEPGQLSYISAYHAVKNLYEERLQQLSQSDKYVSELFFELCQQLFYQGLTTQMNFDDFYRTYPKNSL